MEIVFYIITFLFGTIIGSFLNVIILRFHSRPSFKDRSICFSCGHVLSWYELIPVFSYILQKGRCRHCGSKISPRYIFVELATGLLFASVFFLELSLVQAFYYLVLISILVVIAVYDFDHKIIPNSLVYTFAVLSLGGLFVELSALSWIIPSTADLLSGPALALPFAALWFFSGGKLMGLGDGKLALGIGWGLGLSQGLTAIILAFWIGSVVSLSLLGMFKLLHKTQLSHSSFAITMKSEVPFGPFLILGYFVVLFTGFNLLTLLL